MLDQPNRRPRGGQIGNWNALKHGRRSPRIKAERLAARKAEWEEERKRFEQWSAPILARCQLQTARVLDELERLRAEQEAAEFKNVRFEI